MKGKLICLLVLVMVAACLAAPVENVVSFQGKLVEGGTPVDGTRNINFKLYNVASGGTALWTENHLGVPVTGGLFNVELGGTTTFASAGLDFAQQYWVGISVAGGAEIAPRYKLTGTPYAMADGDWVVTGADMYASNSGNVGIGTTTPTGKLDITGNTMMRYNSDNSVLQMVMGAGNNLYIEPKDNQIDIRTDHITSVDVMTLHKAGNVGIGTTTPTQKLDVNGNFGGNADLVLSRNDASGPAIVLSGTSLPPLRFIVGGNERMKILASGNVGIGTTNPLTTLHVAGSSTDFWSERGSLLITGGGENYRLALGYNSVDHYGWIQSVNTGVAGMPLALNPLHGNVGIGTTNPATQLHTTGTVRFAGAGTPGAGKVLTSDASGTATWQTPSGGSNWTLSGGNVYRSTGNVAIGSSASGVYRLYVNGNTLINTRLGVNYMNASANSALEIGQNSDDYTGGIYLRSTDHIGAAIYREAGDAGAFVIRNNSINTLFIKSGNVGIGTSSPDRPLSIKGYGGNNEMISLQNNAGVTKWHINLIGNGLQIIETGVLNRFRISPGGNVGIGDISASYQLHLTTNSAAKPTSNAWTVVSDGRLKKDVVPYGEGLESIMKIDPVWFTYTGEANMPDDRGVGVIAQDLEEIAPYMVNTWTHSDSNGNETEYLGVDNGAMTYMLINAVQELKAENDELRARIEAIESNR